MLDGAVINKNDEEMSADVQMSAAGLQELRFNLPNWKGG